MYIENISLMPFMIISKKQRVKEEYYNVIRTRKKVQNKRTLINKIPKKRKKDFEFFEKIFECDKFLQL